jgi:quinolinate synthase
MNRKLNDSTAIVAHYYSTPDVQAMADVVGDSLDLAQWITENKPKRVVHASVRFMAETAKILNPEAEVILPDGGSSCSLVEQTDVTELRAWDAVHREKARMQHQDLVHVAYINSSAEHKAIADIIVTSRIVDDVIRELHASYKYVIFSPDRNMGEYLNYQYGYNMPVWKAVCDVHDKFKADELDKAMRAWTDGPKFVLAHPESPLPILKKADYVGSTHGMLNWIREYPNSVGTIFVATEDGLLYNMREERPELDIRQAPIYSGCQCNSCPFMKLNTVKKVLQASVGIGTKIDYLTKKQMEAARRPIERMLEFQRTGRVNV